VQRYQPYRALRCPAFLRACGADRDPRQPGQGSLGCRDPVAESHARLARNDGPSRLTADRLKSGTFTRSADPRMWWLHLAWVLGGAVLGMAVAAVFGGLFRLPRSLYLVPYFVLTSAYLYGYMRWSELDPGKLVRYHWVRGLIGGAVAGAFGVWTVVHQPSSPAPQGFELIFDLGWLGIVYGTVDGLLLSVLPVFAIWEALTELDWTKRWSGRALAGLLTLAGSSAVVAVYHLGYPEFRGVQIVFPVVGVGVMTLAYLVTGNPLAAVISHVAMHFAAVLHGVESVLQLPPHG
jgi:hypothetical protein